MLLKPWVYACVLNYLHICRERLSVLCWLCTLDVKQVKVNSADFTLNLALYPQGSGKLTLYT